SRGPEYRPHELRGHAAHVEPGAPAAPRSLPIRSWRWWAMEGYRQRHYGNAARRNEGRPVQAARGASHAGRDGAAARLVSRHARCADGRTAFADFGVRSRLPLRPPVRRRQRPHGTASIAAARVPSWLRSWAVHLPRRRDRADEGGLLRLAVRIVAGMA